MTYEYTAEKLMRARHLLMMDIYHNDGNEDRVMALHLITEVLMRQTKLAPDDHVGKNVVIIAPEFDEFIPATITFQDIPMVSNDGEEHFVLFYRGEETGGFTRDQFRFVGGD